MDAATVIKAVEAVRKGWKTMKKWIEIDQNRRVRVLQDFIAGRFADVIKGFPSGTVRMGVPDFQCPDFGIVDGVMTIYATGDREPFCDGATYIPDNIGDLSLVAPALVHDALYQHMETLATEWGWPEEDVRFLADATLANNIEAQGSGKGVVWRAASSVLSRVVYAAVRAFGGIYHRSRRLAVALVVLLVLAGGGCVEVPQVFKPGGDAPDIEVYSISSTPPPAESSKVAGNPAGGDSPSPATAPGLGDAVDFGLLQWAWGGFDGTGARPVAGCEIAALKVSASGLSYKWLSGGCESLGATSKTDKDSVLACLFVVGADGAWRGGKFDWISTSRTTRDFANIEEGYNSWPKDAIEAATGFAFVIVSKDGKRRSNVIATGKITAN